MEYRCINERCVRFRCIVARGYPKALRPTEFPATCPHCHEPTDEAIDDGPREAAHDLALDPEPQEEP